MSAEGSFLANVKSIIQRELSNDRLNVDFIAREVGLSRVQLYRKMLALTGTSVSELLRSIRLQKAAKLLEQKWGPVSQVAYAVGITNLSYFSKIFKGKFGIMPSEYEGASKKCLMNLIKENAVPELPGNRSERPGSSKCVQPPTLDMDLNPHFLSFSTS